MVIEIPDELLDFMRKMPEQKEQKSGKSSAMRRKNVLDWINHSLRNGTAYCAVSVTICSKIMETAAQEGYIRFDPETRAWQGVDYEAD